MQNKRKHAYKQGYIKKRGNCQADKDNEPGPSRRLDEDDPADGGAAGAAAVA